MDRAFLDTNVLMGELSSDLMLSLAERPYMLYQPYWNSHVIHELRKHLPRIIARTSGAAEMSRTAAERRIKAMCRTFPQAMTRNWHSRLDEAGRFVSDPFDAQILAGAIASGSDALVTVNLKDFQADDIRERYGIEVMPTSAFLIELLREDRTSTTKALVAMASRHRNPPRNLRELCEECRRLPELAAFADSLERSVAERYEDEVRRMFRPSSSWTQGHDARGWFTRKPYSDPGDVMPPNGIWGWDGNGPAV